MRRGQNKMKTSEGGDLQEAASPHQLEAILYQFVNLYERFTFDRQLSTQQNVEVARLIEEFGKTVAHFKTLEANVRRGLQQSIQQEAESVATHLGGTLTYEISQQVESILGKLQEAVRGAQQALQEYDTALSSTYWKMMGMMVLTAILSSFLIVKFFMPEPLLPLTGQELDTYAKGEFLERVWPRLSSHEREKFLAMGDGQRRA